MNATGKGSEAKCIICEDKAEYCIRGVPGDTYCKDCAEAYFNLLEYLDKLG